MTWPYPAMLVASVLGLLPPFTFIGIPSGAVAVLVILEVWKKRTLANDPNRAKQLPTLARRRDALALLLSTPFFLIVGVAVFGGVFSCLWQLLNPLSLNFSENAVIAPLCVTCGVVCGSVAAVFLLTEIYSMRQEQDRNMAATPAPQSDVDSDR
jgi:uncharacterized membrane protein